MVRCGGVSLWFSMGENRGGEVIGWKVDWGLCHWLATGSEIFDRFGLRRISLDVCDVVLSI